MHVTAHILGLCSLEPFFKLEMKFGHDCVGGRGRGRGSAPGSPELFHLKINRDKFRPEKKEIELQFSDMGIFKPRTKAQTQARWRNKCNVGHKVSKA